MMRWDGPGAVLFFLDKVCSDSFPAYINSGLKKPKATNFAFLNIKFSALIG